MAQPPNITDMPAQNNNSINMSVIAPTPGYHSAILVQAGTPSASTPAPGQDTAMKDIVMSDLTPDRPTSPTAAMSVTNAASPAPLRTGTPARNGTDATSRATSQHPDPAPTIPKEAPPHGAPTRQYINGKVTGALLDGMKQIAKEQPKEPLRVLGEYLLQRSRELERT